MHQLCKNFPYFVSNAFLLLRDLDFRSSSVSVLSVFKISNLPISDSTFKNAPYLCTDKEIKAGRNED